MKKKKHAFLMAFYDVVQDYKKHGFDIYPIEDAQFGDEFMINQINPDGTGGHASTIPDYEYLKAWISGYNRHAIEQQAIQEKGFEEQAKKLKEEQE